MREIKGERSQNKGSDYDGLDKDNLPRELIFSNLAHKSCMIVCCVIYVQLGNWLLSQSQGLDLGTRLKLKLKKTTPLASLRSLTIDLSL